MQIIFMNLLKQVFVGIERISKDIQIEQLGFGVLHQAVK